MEMRSLKISDLREFTEKVFLSMGASNDDAKITADVLLASDRRGILSHGVGRLRWYVDQIRNGVIIPQNKMSIIKETPTMVLISGNDGLGQPVSYHTMEMVIDRAMRNGLAFATVRNSNHYGIAGYYAMMALRHNLIGISATNTSAIVVPTNATEAYLGTNPISVAVPANRKKSWVLDMATSMVALGKLEIASRQKMKIPPFWAVNQEGEPFEDPSRAYEEIIFGHKGGMLPLGGSEEITGGHKGYGLAALVDIFSGVLSGGAFGQQVSHVFKNRPGKVCHFFAALDPSIFLPIEQFKERIDEFIEQATGVQKAKGREKIWYHGEKEWEFEEKFSEEIEIESVVFEDIRKLACELGIDFPF